MIRCATSSVGVLRCKSSAGKAIWSAPSRSASSRALAGREFVERLRHDGEVRARDGLVEAQEDVPGLDVIAFMRPLSSPTTPPVGCCTFLTLDSTTSVPGAITAPDITVVPGPAADAANQSQARATSVSRQVPAD